MPKSEIIKRIRALAVPAKVKADLYLLWQRARRLVGAVLRFIRRHHGFAESLVLGAIVAFQLSRLPWIGRFLALCALVTSAAAGLMREWQEDLSRFSDLPVEG